VPAVATVAASAEPTEWPARDNRDQAFSGIPKNAVDPHFASVRGVGLDPPTVLDKRNRSYMSFSCPVADTVCQPMPCHTLRLVPSLRLKRQGANESYMGLSASGSNTKTQSTLSDFPESPLMHRQPGGCRVWRQPNRRKLDHRRRFTQTRCLAVHTLWRARSVWCAGAFRLYSGNQGSPLCGKVADHTAAP
jgi:hypothetical protein